VLTSITQRILLLLINIKIFLTKRKEKKIIIFIKQKKNEYVADTASIFQSEFREEQKQQ
jgi:hypothetical protein